MARPGPGARALGDEEHAGGAVVQYGATNIQLTPEAKAQILTRAQRQRLNVLSMLISLLVPWALFCVTYACASSSFRYFNPRVACGILVFLGFVVLAVGLNAWAIYVKMAHRETREPEWTIFVFLTMLVGWAMGIILGCLDFSVHTQLFYDYSNMETYHDVDPMHIRGQQIMDAGRVHFNNETRLDLTRSMGFKNFETYCVAPIVHGGFPLATYDLWAVGLNCCSGSTADFHCTEYNDPRAKAGLRLLRDDLRPYFRLAVGQAEAAYNIKAVHPLFFYWTSDPASEADNLHDDSYKYYLIAMLVHFIFQCLCVTLATISFRRLGAF